MVNKFEGEIVEEDLEAHFDDIVISGGILLRKGFKFDPLNNASHALTLIPQGWRAFIRYAGINIWHVILEKWDVDNDTGARPVVSTSGLGIEQAILRAAMEAENGK